MLRMVLRSAKRRTSRSLAVNAPSLKTGWVNRLVVAIGTTRPAASSAWRKRLMWDSRLVSLEPNGIRSSSWKVTPYAPSSARRLTDSTGSSGALVASPNGSRPCHPTVHRPNENLCSGRGVRLSVIGTPIRKGKKQISMRRRGREAQKPGRHHVGTARRDRDRQLHPVGQGRRSRRGQRRHRRRRPCPAHRLLRRGPRERPPAVV